MSPFLGTGSPFFMSPFLGTVGLGGVPIYGDGILFFTEVV